MIAAAAVLLLYRFSFSVPGYEGRHLIKSLLSTQHIFSILTHDSKAQV